MFLTFSLPRFSNNYKEIVPFAAPYIVPILQTSLTISVYVTVAVAITAVICTKIVQMHNPSCPQQLSLDLEDDVEHGELNDIELGNVSEVNGTDGEDMFSNLRTFSTILDEDENPVNSINPRVEKIEHWTPPPPTGPKLTMKQILTIICSITVASILFNLSRWFELEPKEKKVCC